MPVLSLITFSSDHDSRSLGEALWNLGFEYVLIDGEHWLSHGAMQFARPTVLLLSGACAKRDELLALFPAARPDVLGIYSCRNGARNGARDNAILSRCADFVGWPCQETELSTKLERVFGESTSGQAGAETAAPIE